MEANNALKSQNNLPDFFSSDVFETPQTPDTPDLSWRTQQRVSSVSAEETTCLTGAELKSELMNMRSSLQDNELEPQEEPHMRTPTL